MSRVVLAMSGGVDSSVAAWLLKEAGHEVIGLFMRTGVEQEGGPAPNHKKGCCSSLDAADARRVADGLDLPFYALDFSADFGRVMDVFADEYLAGRTPNPCVLCNNWLKFGKLWKYGQELGADFVATGHYARVGVTSPQPFPQRGEGVEVGQPSRPRGEGVQVGLFRSADVAKDQTYVLFGLSRALLPKLLLPLGGYTKDQVRELARRAGLPVHAKPDSVEICFVPAGGAAAFVRGHRGGLAKRGPIVDEAGRVLASHAGIEAFTVGQRKGLGIAAESRRYVLEIVPATATVVVGPRERGMRSTFTAERCNWLVDKPEAPFTAEVKISYRDPAQPATVDPRGAAGMEVRFARPQFGVAPGQAAVVYRGEQVLGGGWISSSQG
jgi:tRNA-specific 2-thiouridylase